MRSKIRAMGFSTIQAIFKWHAKLLPMAPHTYHVVNKYCVGQGLEIGAGKYPYCDRRMTKFLDKHTDNADGTPRPDILSDFNNIPYENGTLDFIFASHVLEHAQNTILTLKEWARVIKPGGVIVLVLPHADRTFDRHRARTTLDHHIRDYETLGDAPDHSHDSEAAEGWGRLENIRDVIAFHERTWGAPFLDFEHRMANDAMHFHVWTQDEVVKLLQYVELRIAVVIEQVPDRTDSFVVVARKPCAG
jgi:SAM-dependent methyltransferase